MASLFSIDPSGLHAPSPTFGSPIPRDEAARPLTRVSFHVRYADVQFGESVLVVGAHPSLGSWAPESALSLTTREDIFPCWVSEEPALIESQAVIEYKYVVMCKDGRLREWEDYDGNRKFTATGAEMTIEDDDGLVRQREPRIQENEEDESLQFAGLLLESTPSVRKQIFEHKMSMVADLETPVNIGTHDTVYIVALALPIKLFRGEGGVWKFDDKAPPDGRNFAWLPLLREFRQKSKVRVVCVGWPGVHVESFSERAEIERLLAMHDYIPVFPPRQDFEKYLQFCTTFLWPVFHDVMMFYQASENLEYDETGWAAYQYVNNLYAAAVVPHTHESDLVWIHDYHLLMAPTFLSRKLVKANIGFYLHAPFPSSGSFKSLPIREELLSGMLCADQLGFQFFAYARNFLISAKRINGYDPVFKPGGFIGLEVNGRQVMIKVAHFVYPFEATKEVVGSSVCERKAAEVKTLFGGKKIFVSMDRCDILSGLVPKFKAFKKFLATYPAYRGKVVFVQYTFETPSGYDSTSGLLEALRDQTDAFLQVGSDGELHIVPKEGRTADDCDIFLRVEKVDRYDRLAMFRAADVLLDTSIKAGLNLMPFEFLTAHHDEEQNQSVVIVSEFSGCSRVLLGSIRINPWNTNDFVAACARSMKMDLSERQELNECNLQYVSDCSPFEWFKDFIVDLRRSKKKEGIRIESIGFGAKIRHVCMTPNFMKLPNEVVLAAYRSAKNRVLFFDNEGTLAADSRGMYREYGAPKGNVSDLKSTGSAPDEKVLQCLRSLCQDPRNTIVILSGRDRQMLEEWFASVPQIGLAAERGFYYKLPMCGQQWHCMQQNPDYTWQSYAYEIMRQFTTRTQGSFIESKGSALVWQYRDADQHFGSWQAKELSTHLKELLFGFDVEVLNGKGYVEVKVRGINKGSAVTKVLSKISNAFGDIDFVLCIGDDRSDEAMFEVLKDLMGPEEETNESTPSQQSTTDGGSDGLSDGDRHHQQPAMSETLGVIAEPANVVFKTSRRASINSPLSGSVSAREDLVRMGSGQFTIKDGFNRMGSSISVLGDDVGGALASQQPRWFTCTVGRKPSAAKFFLDDVEEVTELLANLQAQQERRGLDSSSHTWPGGDVKKFGGTKHGTMPPLSSLNYGTVLR